MGAKPIVLFTLGLIEASGAGNTNEVIKLLRRGVNIDAYDNKGKK